jgi:hypothetical protein
MRKGIFAILLLIFCPIIVAQQPLNNDSVIKLVKAGVSDDLIITEINGSTGSFDTSPDGIIALKTAGASDKLVSAIVLKVAASPVPATARVSTPPAAQDPNDPMSQHEPGIYMMTTNSDGTKKMTLLNPAKARLRNSNTFGNAISMGFSGVRIKADMAGVRAAVRTREIRPDFYIYYPPVGTIGLSTTPGKPSAQFSLRMLEIENDHRITTVAKTSMTSYSGAEKVKRDKWTIDFTSEAIRANVFKMTPNANLSAGEYAFTEEASQATFAPGATYVQTYAKVFDFGVD